MSIVFLHKSIYKLAQNISIAGLSPEFMRHHVLISLTRLIKDHIVLVVSSRKEKQSKMPRAHSTADGLKLAVQSRDDAGGKIGHATASKRHGEEGAAKKGGGSHTFLSLYHSLLIDYPGRRRVACSLRRLCG